jgi:thiamine-phosphate pyrophosphorylase
MHVKKLDSGLYFITDRALSRNGIDEDVKAAIRGGVRVVQYREKSLSKARMIAEAKELAAICGRAGVVFIVNDNVDVAIASGADGVHLGPGDTPVAEARKLLGPGKIIGATASSVADAKKLERAGANYIGLSPIFATPTKRDAGHPIGLAAIKEARKSLRIPFVAIGGINRANLESVLKAGAKNVCMISAILKAENVEREVMEIRRIMHEHPAGKGKE